jgi:hypothetical protein
MSTEYGNSEAISKTSVVISLCKHLATHCTIRLFLHITNGMFVIKIWVHVELSRGCRGNRKENIY